MMESHSSAIQSVTEITRSIRGLLETHFPFVSVSGEISTLRRPYSGHLYFILKDSESQIRAVLFKPQQRYLSGIPEDGQKVVCRGRISLYEARGEYQLLVDYIDFLGTGPLQIAFEQLKNKLATEGLFDGAHKQELPFLPSRVGLITSPTGAAVHDFIKQATTRFPGLPIEIYPTLVQGATAPDSIVASLELANQRQTSEVIVLCRGGGSLEDLWAFNDERVARAIFASKLPVVSAVGHEIDFTIADFVADLRATTPSAAAVAIIPERQLLRDRLATQMRRQWQSIQRNLAIQRDSVLTRRRILSSSALLFANTMLTLDHAQTGLHLATQATLDKKRHRCRELYTSLKEQNPGKRLVQTRQHTNTLARQLHLLLHHNLNNKKARLGKAISLLEAVSPTAILGRGYAIVHSLKDGAIIRHANQTDTGDSLEIRLHKGIIESTVTRIRNK